LGEFEERSFFQQWRREKAENFVEERESEEEKSDFPFYKKNCLKKMINH